MIIQDVSYPSNQGGRVAGTFRDGQFTRYIDVVYRILTICASDLDEKGKPVVLHQNWDLTSVPDFQPTCVVGVKSGYDGKLIVTLGGFTVDAHDSRRLTIKCEFVVKEPWEVYE